MIKKIKVSHFFIVIVFLSILFFIYVYSNYENKPSEIKTIKVGKSNIYRKLLLNGYTVPSKMLNIKPTISGEIVKINYQLGNFVKKGEILVEIKPDPNIVLELITKEKNLWQAEAKFLRNKKLYTESLKLFQKEYMTIKEFGKIKYEYEGSEKELEMLKLSTKFFKNKYGLDSLKADELINAISIIRAPINGVILRNFVNVGYYIKSALSQYNEGTSICTIGDVTEFIVKLVISESEVEKIYKGQKVKIYKDNSSQSDTGFINQISPLGNIETEPISFDFDVIFKPINSEYKAGSSVNIEIIIEKKEDIITIPIKSVLMERNSSFVFLKNQNKYIIKEIETGISDNHKVEVISGLNMGDLVVYNPEILKK